MSRECSFEVWTRNHDHSFQEDIDKDKCVEKFWEDYGDDYTPTKGPCKKKKKNGEDIFLVKNWMSQRKKKGKSTVEFVMRVS